MNNKFKNSIAAIIQSLILFLTFLPGFYIYEKDVYSSDLLQKNINMFKSTQYISGWDYGRLDVPHETFYDLRKTLCVILTIVIISSTILFLVQYIKNKNWGVLVSLPIFELISLGALSYYTANAYGHSGSMGYWTLEYLNLGMWFYVEIILLISLFIYSLVCYKKVATNGDIIKEKICKNSSADEIKKFKELFDDGIITEEEFEEKKKKLLNI